ncbi:hypothetical protein [Allorhizocola rhizosphaerae]|uniref:hypothetical protein n=1 Tax=Allorhizocola rhizosphaerae TaxID=1872709 RepID=UPI0013C2BB78|nr:hypothetical protein [Allorhizocola rhizosphaerae]
MEPQAHSGRATALAVFGVAAMVAVGACSPRIEDVAAQPAQAPPSRSVQLSADQQALVDTAWQSYVKLNTIYIKAAQTGVYDWNDDHTKRPLSDYAAGAFLTALERDLELMREQSAVRTGDPKITLRRVVSVSPTTIIIESCVDDSGTDTINKTTKKSVAAPGQNKKYPVTLRAGLYPDSRWRWVESYADRSSTC